MTQCSKAISVHDRLLNRAQAKGEDFNLLLTRYSLERFLYRIAISEYREQFLLKGALLFDLWFESPHRPTRDMDLLGFGANDEARYRAVMQEICSIENDDGMVFLPKSVKIQHIRHDANYGGIRVEVLGMLGNARCPVQVDIGFGDAVTPEPIEVFFPTILDDSPAPLLKAYPKETVIAEKLETIVSLGMINSRMKDYFDLYVLLREPASDGSVILEAIARTFARRGTMIPNGLPIGLSDEFAENPLKVLQWRAFLTKNGIEAPPLAEVVALIRERSKTMLLKARTSNR